MRRGRPVKSPTVHSTATSRTRAADPPPGIRAVSADPFAALDAGPSKASQDELSGRFPSVEQFSLLHDYGNKFEFSESVSFAPESGKKDLNTRLTEKLADDAFAPTNQPPPQKQAASRVPDGVSRGVTGSGIPSWPSLSEPQPTRAPMVSTGTMTSPTPSRSPSPRVEPLIPELGGYSMGKSEQRSHQHASHETTQSKSQRLPVPEASRPLIHTATLSRTPSPSRPSLDIHRPASALDITYPSPIGRPASANSRPRPTSVYIESNLEFLRDLDSATTQASVGTSSGIFIHRASTGQSISSQRSEHIESNVDFLRAMESESDAKPEKRIASGGFVGKHIKRASMPSISLPNTKSLLAGKFGDAFRRFERNNTGGNDRHHQDKTPSPDMDRVLMPASDDDWEVISQDVPPEMKRELEKRRLSQEERRVAAAAAEYKRQVADRVPGEGGSVRISSSKNRASSIQTKVQALLSENHRAPAPKAVEGYGRFTDVQQHQQSSHPTEHTSGRVRVPEKPRADGHVLSKQYHRDSNYRPAGPGDHSRIKESIIEIRPASSSGTVHKIPRKPVVLAPTPGVPTSSTSPTSANRPDPPRKPTKLRGNSPSLPMPRNGEPEGGTNGADGAADDDWQSSFAKRYPSLSGLEMVETVVGPGRKG